MWRLFFCFYIILAIQTPGPARAGTRDIVMAKYKVNGVCEQCKKRIEDAAYIKGVKYADWNVESHDLTVKYDSSKTSFELILKSVAKAGHDSKYFTALPEDYNKLPSCCRYKSGIKMH